MKIIEVSPLSREAAINVLRLLIKFKKAKDKRKVELVKRDAP